jgi:nucleoside-diphosphate-sugar epimerase
MAGFIMNIFCFGLGYSAQRLHQLSKDQISSFAGTTRNPEKAAALTRLGIKACRVDDLASPALQTAIHTADRLLISAAPDENGDPTLKTFGDMISRAQNLRQIIYWSTIGVYGDHGGAWIDETAPLNAISERGKRRIVAEQAWLEMGRMLNIPVQIHRLAGIYGPGRSVIDDYTEGTARRIIKAGQVFNRIHVDDIAGAAFAGFQHPEINGAFNICDDLPCPPQDVVEYAGFLLQMPIPPEIPFAEAKLSEMGRSFYSESKRCENKRLKSLLNYKPRYPNYRAGLQSLLHSQIPPIGSKTV